MPTTMTRPRRCGLSVHSGHLMTPANDARHAIAGVVRGRDDIRGGA